ncbi:ABC transporter permease subunit [Streptomyces boninensis]|uniref:ABC transporter permease subunit n=1 Tax=Streptomyces boninensis TaxID=2039455 RepID=UPI003B20F001
MADVTAATAFEWSKLSSLRSTMWSLVAYATVSIAGAVALGVLIGMRYEEMTAAGKADFDPVSAGFSALRLGMIALVVFGVLAVSSEYASGTIRSSLAAVPRRGVFYGAKLLAGGAAAFGVSAAVVLASFFAAQAAMGSGAPSVSLTDAGVPRAVIGAVLYTTLLCLFAMGLAALLRSAALTMGILVPLFFVISGILSSVPGVQQAAQFLPDVAGGLVLVRTPPSDTVLNAWTGMGVLAGWTALALLAGYTATRKRDA